MVLLHINRAIGYYNFFSYNTSIQYVSYFIILFFKVVNKILSLYTSKFHI